jgi:hypothetical protein
MGSIQPYGLSFPAPKHDPCSELKERRPKWCFWLNFYQEYEEHCKNPKTKSKLQTGLHQIKGI